MCVLAIKYFDDKIGWVGAKNRDRSYKPDIRIKQSFKNGVERCLLWDEKTKWTEGLNEFGVSVINTTMKVAKDEKEGALLKKRPSNRIFYSPGGKAVRTALYEKTPKAALQKLIELQMEGFCAVFSKDEAYILESPIYVDDPDAPYQYKFVKCEKDKVYVRTNHGIFFPDGGYHIESDNESLVKSRESSESRYKIALAGVKSAKSPIDLIRALSVTPDKNPQMNPLRVSDTHGKHIMVTTSQLLLTPYNRTIHHRAIWCNSNIDYEKINGEETKTWVEIVTAKSLIDEGLGNCYSIKEFIFSKRKDLQSDPNTI